MPLNFGVAGKSYEPARMKITATQIAEYAAASGDDNPAHRTGPDQVAPAVFPVVPAFGVLARVVMDPELGVDNPLMMVHGAQEFVYHRPICPDTEVTVHPSIVAVEDKGKGATFTTRVDVVDEDGEVLVSEYATAFVRGGGSGAERPRRDQPEPVRGARVTEFASHVAADMPVRYAAASGDHNPIHVDEQVARAVGLPRAINHGLGTLSLVAGGLVQRLAGGDVGRLRRLQARFTDMVFPGDDVTTTVWESAHGYGFETRRDDGTTVLRGAVEVGD